ncbi:hypothetical protein [Halopelagius fulvigenes]|uniref:Uncharacterized protein n=1 Tax=Halopelagius fulvigenes TaxID=1198324 RepID=A0ABD5U2M8_9EURY
MPDEGSSQPIRKIDDATFDAPPRNTAKRRLFRTKRWFLLDANRYAVALSLLSASFVAIVLIGSFGPVPVRAFLTEGVSPGTVLVELLKAIVSVVVIVLSINQLVLSPGLGPVGDQQERFDQSIDLRREVEDRVGMEVSPTSPAAFLAALLDAIDDQARHLEEGASRTGDRAFERQTTAFTRRAIDEAESVSPLLSSGRFGKFDVISAALRFSISEKIWSIRRISKTHDDSFTDPVTEAFDEMRELLRQYTVAREYLKTVYIREEYIRLSEGLLYTGLPAIILTFCASQIYGPGVFPGQAFGIERRLLFVSGAVSVALAPFVLLISYVFRLAAMSRSTLFVGPFDAGKEGERTEDGPGHGR